MIQTRYYMMLGHGIECNRTAAFDRLLRRKTHGDGPATIGGATRKLATLPDRADEHRHLVFQLEHFARDFIDRDLLNLFAVESSERKRGVQRTVYGAAPGRPECTLGAGNFYGLMVFESCKRLRNHGVCALRKMQDCREVVLKLFVPHLPRAGRGVHGLRIAERAEIPTGQI